MATYMNKVNIFKAMDLTTTANEQFDLQGTWFLIENQCQL